MQPFYCALARTFSNFNRLQLRSKAVSGPRSWSPQTAITQTTFWDERTADLRATHLLTKGNHDRWASEDAVFALRELTRRVTRKK